MVISKAEHLASLADILGGARAADAARLRATAAALREDLGAYTWDEQSKVRRISSWPSSWTNLSLRHQVFPEVGPISALYRCVPGKQHECMGELASFGPA
jgi:hypothetical protein